MNDGEERKPKFKKSIGEAVTEKSLSHQGNSLPSPSASPILEGFYMDSLGTYIYLFRKIRDTSFYKDSYALHLAIHCLLKANRFAKQVIIGNQAIDISIGQFVTGRHKLYLETGIAESTIRNKLFLLCKVRFMDIKATTKYSIITVINYEKYQITLENRTAPKPTDRPTSEHNKESIRKIKNDKNIDIPPPLDSIKDFFKELNKPLEASAFFNHYEANGWKVGKVPMRKWKAAARNWARREFNKPKDKEEIEYREFDKEKEVDVDTSPEGLKRVSGLVKGIFKNKEK